jgi:hypothetical protein
VRHDSIPAIIRLYPTGRNGSMKPILPGFSCICRVDPSERAAGWSLYLNLTGPLSPGETLYIEMDFLVDAGLIAVQENSGKFYLWDRGIFGEGRLV